MRKIFGILLFSLLLLAGCGTKQSQPEVTDETIDTVSVEEPADSLYMEAPAEDTVAVEEEIAL